MNDIQKRVSGPVDVGVAEQILHSLDELFPLAEQARHHSSASEEMEEMSDYNQNHSGAIKELAGFA